MLLRLASPSRVVVALAQCRHHAAYCEDFDIVHGL